MARFTDVDLFLGVADAGSFRGAAEKLAVTSSTVSRGVQRLEQHLGTPLLMRDTRNVKLTDAGAEYLRHARRAAVSLTEGERTVASLSDAIAGTLRVSCTNIVAQTIVRGIVTDFLRKHPRVSVDLVLTTRLVNPLLDDIDLAVRVGKRLADSDLRSRVLFRSELMGAATPEVAARIGSGAPVPMVVFRRPGGRTQTLPPVPHHTRLSADDYPVVLEAIRDGVGVGLVDEALIFEDLREGRLVRVLPEWKLGEVSYWAVYPKSGRLPASLRALLDALTAGLAARRCSSGGGRRRTKRAK